MSEGAPLDNCCGIHKTLCRVTLTAFDTTADMFVMNKISEICAQINLQLDELHTVEKSGLHCKGIIARSLVCGTAKYTSWYKISEGHISHVLWRHDFQ